MYFERHGTGPPLALLHGAFGTIESCFAELRPALARDFEVIAIELQGHEHTRDIDRPLTYVDRPPIRGRWSGRSTSAAPTSSGTAWEARLHSSWLSTAPSWSTISSSPAARPSIRAGCTPNSWRASSPSTPISSTGPAGTRRIAGLRPIRMRGYRSSSWPRDRLAALQAPTLLINGDADIVRPEHAVEMFRLLGGGVPGDIAGMARAQLAVLPGTSHEGVLDRVDWLTSMIVAFLGLDDRGNRGATSSGGPAS
jgi:pimeloyl-ACP methyl ester carboxylesterase